jgi:hypothetical protein
LATARSIGEKCGCSIVAISRSENIVEIAAWRSRQAIQQHPRSLIGRQYAPRLVDRDKSGGQRMQVLASIMKGDQDIPAMTLAKQPVLNLRCGHANQGGGVRLA